MTRNDVIIEARLFFKWSDDKKYIEINYYDVLLFAEHCLNKQLLEFHTIKITNENKINEY